ncbi:MAG TPA: TetR/AcrR family transcriptional regulator [Ktedonobacterales bacterium]|nr:TetR/AcrR family transcriptional regulator [Ktedonobacterales bacterium]
MDEHYQFESAPPPAPPEAGLAGLAGLTPPREPKQARSRAKRKRLLAAALAVFEERGYEGATIDAIAAGARVSVGVFYSYFRSKRQMLLTLIQERVEQMSFNLIDLYPLRISFDQLEANLLGQLRQARVYVGLRRARRELALSDDEVAGYERQQRTLIRARLAEIIKQGREVGFLRADLDDLATATTIIALIEQLQEWVSDLPPEEEIRTAHAAALMIFRMVTPLTTSEGDHTSSSAEPAR